MYIESHYLAHRSVRKRHHIAHIIISIIVILATSIDMALNTWFSYCWWNFGLARASSFTTFSNLKNESTISDVNSDVCESLRALVEENCPNFCNYINGFEIGGVFMILFGIMSLIFHVICVLFHAWSSFKVEFKFKKIGVFLVLPSCFYIIGIIFYNGFINFLSIDKPNTKTNETRDLEIKFGFYLSIALVPLNLFLSAYGLLKTRIAFTEANI